MQAQAAGAAGEQLDVVAHVSRGQSACADGWRSACLACPRTSVKPAPPTPPSLLPLLPAQVDAAWDEAVAALKGVLGPAFSGATAAAAMLTVKDFILLVCLALGEPS